MATFRLVPRAAVFGMALLSVIHTRPAEASSLSCVGVSVAAPGSTSVLNMIGQGVPGCVVAPNGALTFTGTMLAGADLGSPTGTTSYTYASFGALVSDTGTQGPTSFTY